MDTIPRKRFDFYRKWFQALLIKEFLNLPLKLQDQFIVLAEKFLADCRRIHTEAAEISEKSVAILVKEVREHNMESLMVVGTVDGSEVKVMIPVTVGKPAVGSSIPWTVFSMDKETWYSSKEELIAGRVR